MANEVRISMDLLDSSIELLEEVAVMVSPALTGKIMKLYRKLVELKAIEETRYACMPTAGSTTKSSDDYAYSNEKDKFWRCAEFKAVCIDFDILFQIKELLQGNQKIQAIKLLRLHHPLGLKEAKQIVEIIQDQMSHR